MSAFARGAAAVVGVAESDLGIVGPAMSSGGSDGAGDDPRARGLRARAQRY